MKLICIKCPRGCELTVTGNSVTGNLCPRGVDYAKEESENPKRIVTSLIKVDDRVVPVKTDKEVPKDMIDKVLRKISKIKVKNPKIGDIVVKNILKTGVNIVVTGEIYK
jgi:CxxC motif-containing protein